MFLVTSKTPIISSADVVTGKDVKSAYIYLSAMREQVFNTKSTLKVALPEEKANAIFLIAQNFGNMRFKVNFGDNVGVLAGQLKIDVFSMPLYLNLFCEIGESQDGLLTNCAVGQLPIPQKLLEFLILQTTSIVAGKNAKQVVDAIYNESYIHEGVLLSVVEKPRELGASIRARKHDMLTISKQLFVKNEVSKAAVESYLEALSRIKTNEVELSLFVKVALSYASTSPNGLSATMENEAAIWALAIYMGSSQFASLLNMNSSQYNNRAATINGRIDLAMHYLYSAVIELSANRSYSQQIGILKELLDSEGGSGFSFYDLLADRAGTKLAMYATSSEETAELLQQHALNQTFRLLPQMVSLQEGIQSDEFTNTYQNMESRIFKQAIMNIDKEIDLLPMFNE